MPENVDVELANRDGAASTVSSVGAKDSQNNIKLMVDLGDKGAMEIPLTGKLVVAPRHADNNDFEFFMEMRGWILMVATLFVAMAFQGAMQPPGWMPKGDWIGVLPKHYGTTTGATSSSSHADRPAMPAPPLSPPPAITVGPPPAITVGQARRAEWYVNCNAFTFALALNLVVLLVVTANKNTAAPRLTALAMYCVKILVAFIACSVAVTFVLGTSDEPHVIKFVSITIALWTAYTMIIFSLPFILAKIKS